MVTLARGEGGLQGPSQEWKGVVCSFLLHCTPPVSGQEATCALAFASLNAVLGTDCWFELRESREITLQSI